MNNKIALKLSLYFALLLLIFSLLIGSVFFFLFRDHSLNLHRADLESRALSIARTLEQFSDTRGKSGMGGGGMMGMGMYYRFLGDIAGADIWIIDSDRNLVTYGMGKNSTRTNINFSDLPPNAEHVIENAFQDQVVAGEDFSSILDEPTLTVGVPVKDSSGKVVEIVLLHSPVHGVNDSIAAGGKILVISVGIALALSVLFSFWLSKNFTDPIVSKEALDALRMENTRREFVANISHELRTPVTVLRGSLEALNDGIVTEPTQVEEYHRQMLDETLYLQRLVGDLLDLSKLQNSDFSLEKQDILVGEVLRDAVRSMGSIAGPKQVLIQTNISEIPLEFLGDYGRLRQMLLIILDNAVKFSPQGSIIEVALQGHKLTIHDHGPGISAEDLPNIFERFYQSRSEQNKSGTGLGLAIAKQIADRHGIILTATSVLTVGSSFCFEFPQ